MKTLKHNSFRTLIPLGFVNMFLNSNFTNSNEDEVLIKIRTKNKVTLTQKTSLFCKVNGETQPFIEGYLSQSLLWDNWVVTFLQDKLDVEKVDHPFVKFRKDTSLELLLASVNFFFIINSPLRRLVISFFCYFFSFFLFFQFCFTHQFPNLCLIYCDLKFSIYKWSKCKMMKMAGLKHCTFTSMQHSKQFDEPFFVFAGVYF